MLESMSREDQRRVVHVRQRSGCMMDCARCCFTPVHLGSTVPMASYSYSLLQKELSNVRHLASLTRSLPHVSVVLVASRLEVSSSYHRYSVPRCLTVEQHGKSYGFPDDRNKPVHSSPVIYRPSEHLSCTARVIALSLQIPKPLGDHITWETWGGGSTNKPACVTLVCGAAAVHVQAIDGGGAIDSSKSWKLRAFPERFRLVYSD